MTKKLMSDAQKARLLERAHRKITWRGKTCSIGGWANEYATVTTSRPGFWGTSWEAIARAIESGSLDTENVWFISHGWLGYEEGDVDNDD